MSLFRDVDEYDDHSLQSLLDHRVRMRSKGVCDYCLRTPDTKPCRFPERHRHPDIVREGIPTNVYLTGKSGETRYVCAVSGCWVAIEKCTDPRHREASR